MENRLTRYVRWPFIFALGAVSLLFPFVVFRLAMPAQGIALDTRLAYTVADARAALGALTPAQRSAAAWGHLTLDGLYPLIYGLFFALLLIRLWPAKPWWRLAFPIVAADWLENALLAALYRLYPRSMGLVPWASAATTLKWALIGLAAVLALAGVARAAFRRAKMR